MTENRDKVKLKVDRGGGVGDVDVEVEFPGNSNRGKKEKKELQKVITGTVIKQKKSIGKRLSSNLLGDDGESISAYVMKDIIIPSAKNTVFEMFSSLSDMARGSIELALFGKRSNSRGRRDTGPYVSYDKYYSRKDTSRSRYETTPARREISKRDRETHTFDDIVLSSRGDAQEVLNTLVDLTETYGEATVADLYRLVEVTSAYTDTKYGWDNLGSATISRVRGGYLINMPKPRLLD